MNKKIKYIIKLLSSLVGVAIIYYIFYLERGYRFEIGRNYKAILLSALIIISIFGLFEIIKYFRSDEKKYWIVSILLFIIFSFLSLYSIYLLLIFEIFSSVGGF